VHRDLKPANVLLGGQGRAVLADFGLARLPGAPAVFRTSAATVTGTPQFMSPEQIVRPDAATPAIDAYAFGMLSYRLLTGAYPFAAPTVADLYRHHLASPPTPPWVLRPGFPPAAGHAILQALSKDAATRLPPDRLAAALTALPATVWAALPPLPHPGARSGSIRGDTGLGTSTDDTDAAEPRVPDGPAGPGTAGGPPPRVIHLPQREQWIATTAPPMPPDRRSRHRLVLLLAVVAGIVAGIALFLLLR
jgi:serine/threonine protein kinase